MSRVDRSPSPPGRRWYAVAAAVAAVGLLAAIAVFVIGIRSWLGDFPKLGTPFRGGEPVPVELRAGQPAVLYVSPDTAASDWRCTADPAGSPVAVTEAPYTFTFFSGGRTWAARYEIRAERDGSAQLTCVAVAGAGDPLLAVGDQPDNPRLLRKLAGTIAAGGGLALVSLVLGGGLALIARRRRRRSGRTSTVFDAG